VDRPPGGGEHGADHEPARPQRHQELTLLARALTRATESGISISDTVTALAAELAERSRAEAEDRARRVGVRAAVPLGVCLLPAFLLLGIVPTVVSLAAAIRW
jgi:pilus assembly protein TadC